MRGKIHSALIALLFLALCHNALGQSNYDERYLWKPRSPKAGDTIDGSGGIYIVLEFNKDYTFNPTSLHMFIDDELIGANVRVKDNVFYAIYSEALKPGTHRITVDLQSTTGMWFNPYEWSFYVQDMKQKMLDSLKQNNLPIPKEPWKLNGTLIAESRLEDINGPGKSLRQEPPHTNQVNFNATATKKDWTLHSRIFATSDERQYQTNFQSKNYLQFGAQWKGIGITVGDMNPVFDRLVLTGTRVEGGMLTLKHRKKELTIVRGILARKLEGEIKQLSPGEYPQTLLRPDSTYLVPGTYRRNVTAARFQFGVISEGNQFGISFLKAKDDVTSIINGEAPKDNVVIGIDQKFQTFDGKLKAAWGLAMSGFTNDISKGYLTKAQLDSVVGDNTQPLDPAKLKNFLIINESTLVPSARSRASYINFTKVIFRSHQLFFEYKKNGPAFVSFGNPFQRVNQTSYEAQERYNFWKRKITGNLRYQYLQNNLGGEDLSTLFTNIYAGYINFSLGQKIPVLSAGFMDQYRKSASDKSILFSQNDVLKSTNITLSHNFKAWGGQHIINLNYMQTARSDKNNPLNNNKTRVYAATLTEKLQAPVIIDLSYNLVNLLDASDAVSPLTSSYGATVRYNWQKKKLSFAGSYLNNTMFANPYSPQANRPAYRLYITWTKIKNMKFDFEFGSSPNRDALNPNNNYNENYVYVRYTYNFAASL